MTTSVCQATAETLEFITSGLETGEGVEFRDRTGMHMDLHVDRLQAVAGGSLFAVAHRHADREPVVDPEVTMLRTRDGHWIPLSIALPLSMVATAGADGVVLRERRGEHRKLVKLVDVWMRNVSINLLSRDSLEDQEISPAVAYAAE